ncbi:DNA repair protein RadC [Pedobacter westerhofensis]|uniref:DNA repair protein RadC n=1 Tax=Pedobacter westerhofensis TaxID=425512 RepID=A0A521FQ32_9SPHI|nr:JAB domain-containing protein [Pedobacter westerhofensis]SMO98303.1 DNA repair protein RadC [Pedobacter westerhofensis]
MRPISLSQIPEITLKYRPKVRASERLTLRDSKDVYALLRKKWDSNLIELQEQFKIVLLNSSAQLIGIADLSSGGTTGTIADPKIIFATALKAGAFAIILAHNHPSGNLVASDEDIRSTKKIKDGAQLLDLFVYDHIIVTKEGYLSLADEGMM